MTHTMWDSANALAIPVGGGPADATAGYLPGSGYPSSAEMRRRVPNKPHVTITTTARVDADCLDVEPRCATPGEAPGWFDRAPGNRIIYCPASWTSQLRAALGNRNYLLWSAHYTGKSHICGSGCGYPQADATQWIDHGPAGENVDQSALGDKFWAAIAGPGQGDDMPSTEEIVNAVWGHVLEGQGMRHTAGGFLVDTRAAQITAPKEVWDHVLEGRGLHTTAEGFLVDVRAAQIIAAQAAAAAEAAAAVAAQLAELLAATAAAAAAVEAEDE